MILVSRGGVCLCMGGVGRRCRFRLGVLGAGFPSVFWRVLFGIQTDLKEHRHGKLSSQNGMCTLRCIHGHHRARVDVTSFGCVTSICLYNLGSKRSNRKLIHLQAAHSS